MAKRQQVVSLTAEQREELDALLRRPSIVAGLAKRARAIVLLAEGANISATGRLVQMQRRHLYKWIARFRQLGVAGLSDGKRSGRPPVFSPRSRDSSGQDRLRTAG
jgi:Helix-turn-helix domain